MLDYSNKRLAVNTLYNLAGRILPLFVGIVTIPILINQLGLERYGLLIIAWSVVGYFGLLDLGLGLATTKFVSEYLALDNFAEIPELVWTSLILLFGLGLVAGSLVYLSTPWLVDKFFKISPHLIGEATQSFYILSVTIPFVFTTACMTGVLEAQQRFALINTVQVPASIANYVAPLPILFFSNSLIPIVAMTAGLRLLVCLVFLFLGLRSLPGMNRMRLPRLLYAKQLLGFGGWLTVSGLVNPVMMYLDRFLIGAWLSMELVAYYVTPYLVVTKLWIIPFSLMPVLFPAFSAFAAENQGRLATLYHRAIKYVFLALAPIIFSIIVLARPFLNLWLGEKFATMSTPIMQLLAVGVLINSLGFIARRALQAMGRPDLPAKLHLLELPVYLGLIYVLVHTLGLIGVALAWVLRAVLDGGMLFWWASRLMPKTQEVYTYNKLALFIGMVMLTVGALASVMIPNLTTQIIILPVWLICLAIWAWRFLLDDTEKAKIYLTKDKLINMKGSF